VEAVRVRTRRAPFAFVSMQLGLGSPALTLIVPVEVKMKHVSLQPVSEIPNKGHTSRRTFQTYLHRARVFLATGSAMRHLRTSGSSRVGSYSTSECPTPSRSCRLAYLIATTFLAPLVAGMLVRYFWPRLAERISEPLSTAAGFVLLVPVLLILLTTFSAVVSAGRSAFLLIIATTFRGLALGHFLGGPDPNDRTTLALACATRFPALALLIASLNFPNAKPMPVVVTYLLTSNLAALPYVRWRKGRQGA
jgi:hypothetical protein